MPRNLSLLLAVSLSLALVAPGAATAATFTIEPDNYPAATRLNTISPYVTLSVVDQANTRLGFNVRAAPDGLNFEPTGELVFGQETVQFWNNSRRLKMAFAVPMDSIRIDFAGGNTVTTEIGRLEIYDASDGLLDTYVTAPRHGGEVEAMALSRPTADIAYAVAYVASGDGNFGRLDHLVFTPEPAVLSVLLVGGAALLRRRRSSR